MRLRSVCFLIAAVLTGQNATGQELVPTTFHVAGNAIVDPSGNEVVFRGVNPQDPIWQALCGDADMMPWQEAQFQEIADWGANIVRLSVFPGSWRQFGETRSLQVMDQFIAWAAQHGLYVFIDMHSIGFPPTEQYEVDTDDCFSALGGEIYRTTQSEITAFWRAVTQRYGANEAVAFYEIFNEPDHNGATGNLSDWKRWREYAEGLIDQIRSLDPDKPVIVGGLQFAYDLSFADTHPVRRSNVIYGVHPYPDADFKRLWSKAFGDLKDSAPVFATEFGFQNPAQWPESSCRTCSGLYRSDLISFLGDRNISWTVWSFSDTWGPTLVSDKKYTPTESGAFFRTAMQSSSPARALTGEQRSCVNAINKAGAAIMKAHGQADVKCVRNATDGGPVPGGSVAACVKIELGARVVRSLAKLDAQDARRCQAKPRQLPGFGYSGAATVSQAALAASRDLVVDLYGSDLDAAIVSTGADLGGATCQRVVLAGVTAVLDRLWRLARTAKKQALAAKVSSAVTSAAGLTEAIGTSIDLDASGQLAKEIARLASSTTQVCSSGATATPLSQLFAGRCSVSQDAEALAACAAEIARCRFCVALREFDVLAVNCDDFDNGLADASCS